LAELALYAPDVASKSESIGRDAVAAAAGLTGHVGTALYVSPEMLNSDARYNQVCSFSISEDLYRKSMFHLLTCLFTYRNMALCLTDLARMHFSTMTV